MLRQTALLISAAAFLSAASGCRPLFQMRSNQTFWEGQLPDNRQVSLRQEMYQDCLVNTPENNYCVLSVSAASEQSVPTDREVARQTGKSGHVPDFQFGRIEARTDASTQKVWFIDTSTGRVVASLDLQSGLTTGPHAPAPAWADPNAGQPLTPASS